MKTNSMIENGTVGVIVGHIDEYGKYFEDCINDIAVKKLPDDVIGALDTDYDIAIRLENYASIAVFAKDQHTLNSYLEGKGVPDYIQCFFEELSEYPPDVMWYYSDVSKVDKF